MLRWGAAAALGVALWRGDLLWNGGRSLPLFNFWRRKGFSLEQMPDLSNQVAFVTGASSGIGREVARQLARANATVLVGCRDVSKCSDFRAYHLDLEAFGHKSRSFLKAKDLQQTAQLAHELKQLPRLDILAPGRHSREV